jgi:hypothetical protein
MQDYSPRPKASQQVAAAHRAAQHDTEPIEPSELPASTRRQLAIGVGAMVLIALMIAMASYQLSRTPARPLQIQPTDIPASTLAAPATSAPAPSSEATAAIAPTYTPMPTQAPPIGQGLTLDPIVPTDPPAPAEPSYIENVGQQAPHCVRSCDGQPGPAGGDWVAVPTLAPAMLEVIGQQAPHKVR